MTVEDTSTHLSPVVSLETKAPDATEAQPIEASPTIDTTPSEPDTGPTILSNDFPSLSDRTLPPTVTLTGSRHGSASSPLEYPFDDFTKLTPPSYPPPPIPNSPSSSFGSASFPSPPPNLPSPGVCSPFSLPPPPGSSPVSIFSNLPATPPAGYPPSQSPTFPTPPRSPSYPTPPSPLRTSTSSSGSKSRPLPPFPSLSPSPGSPPAFTSPYPQPPSPQGSPASSSFSTKPRPSPLSVFPSPGTPPVSSRTPPSLQRRLASPFLQESPAASSPQSLFQFDSPKSQSPQMSAQASLQSSKQRSPSGSPPSPFVPFDTPSPARPQLQPVIAGANRGQINEDPNEIPKRDIHFHSLNVLGLNSYNFHRYIGNKQKALIYFYNTNTCPNAALENDFALAANKITNPYFGFAAVDCLYDERLCEQQGIVNTPSLKLFSNGFEVSTINVPGSFTADQMHMLMKMTPILTQPRLELGKTILSRPQESKKKQRKLMCF